MEYYVQLHKQENWHKNELELTSLVPEKQHRGEGSERSEKRSQEETRLRYSPTMSHATHLVKSEYYKRDYVHCREKKQQRRNLRDAHYFTHKAE